MHIINLLGVTALFLEICILNTCALITERLFVKDSQFDGHSCTSGDTVETFGNVRNRIACIARVVESGCQDVFYFPGTNMCKGCYTFYSKDLQPTLSSEISLHYKPGLECPTSFVRYNTSCYMVTETKMDWNSAKDYCVSVNAHLAIIEDVEENIFIGNYLDSKGVGSLDGRIYIGLTDSQEEDKWLTVDGDIQSFFHWTPGQPSEHLSTLFNEDCAGINMDEPMKTWNDNTCSEVHFAVCETELI